ncbi:MAG: DNA-directed DNA polymerase I [Desulfurococcaceae archaeon]
MGLAQGRAGGPRLVHRLEKPSYLLDVYYDGELGSAVLVFVDEEGEEVYHVPDPVGHRPYFLVNMPPEEVEKVVGAVGDERPVIGIEEVRKADPLTMQTIRLTKVVVKDPLVVRKLRERFPRAWEAKIKYHNNYIYDNGLIPGMRYVVVNRTIKIVKPEIPPEVLKSLEELFSKEDPETAALAREHLHVFEEPPPKVRRVAVDIEVYTPFRGRVPNPRLAEYPIISVALVGTDGNKRVLVLARDVPWGEAPAEYPRDARIEVFDSERALIAEVFEELSKYPVVVTFNGDEFDLQYLYNRALKLGMSQREMPLRPAEDGVRLVTGIHIDLYKFFSNKAIKNYAFGGKYQEENLDSVATALLGISKIQLDTSVSELDMATLITYNYRDAYLTLALTTFDDELTWKLMILLARISRTGLTDVCRKQISNWIQNMVFWEHRRRGYLIPEKDDIARMGVSAATRATIEGKKYAGALVVEPPKGVFFKVAVLDIASLYPSIIKKYNLSYETVDARWCSKRAPIEDELNRKIHEVCLDKPGLMSQLVGILRDFRVGIYKKRSKDKSLSKEQRTWYDVVQRALKVFINASYGVFGDESFPLYSPAVAESVTALGRRSFYMIVSKSAELGMKILYGDTDSIFLWSPEPQQLSRLQEWTANSLGLEIELDKVFTYVVFTGLKKNYLGRLEGGGMDIKGLLGKKRNVPDFLKALFEEIISALDKISSPEDFIAFEDLLRERMRNVYMELRNREVTLDQLAFRVGLNKDPREYTKTTPPHVKAALQLMKYGFSVEENDIILYVKVKGKEGYKALQLAKLSEVDPGKYVELLRSVFEQFLGALGIRWEDVIGMSLTELWGSTRGG